MVVAYFHESASDREGLSCAPGESSLAGSTSSSAQSWRGRMANWPSLPGATSTSTPARPGHAFGSHNFDRERHRLGLRQLAALFDRGFDAADHVEGLFRQAVMQAVEDLLEPANRVTNGHVSPGRAGELLGHEHRLREEALNLRARATVSLSSSESSSMPRMAMMSWRSR